MEERRSPAWAKAAVALFSALIFVVGLAGAPDDLRMWYGWLQRGAPWWVLIGASVVLPLLVWAPDITSRVRRRNKSKRTTGQVVPALKFPAPELEPLTLADALQEHIDLPPSNKEMLDAALQRESQAQQKIQVVQEGSAELQRQVDDRDTVVARLSTELATGQRERKEERSELKTKIQKLQGELQDEIKERDVVKALLEQTQARAAEFYNELRYGTSVPKYPECDNASEAAQLQAELEKLKPRLTKAEEGVWAVAHVLFDALVSYGEDEREFFLAYFVYERVMGPVKYTADLFREVLSARHDARGPLMAFYERYNHLREWIPRMALFGEKNLKAMTSYMDWLPHDQQFFEDLDVVLEIHQLSRAKKDKRQSDLAHNWPREMP